VPADVDTDVIVIGAGAAGLTAAADLSRSGVSLIVLEGRDRIGGRIHTVQDSAFPMPVEMGAEYIHGDSPEAFHMAQVARRPLCTIAGDHFHYIGERLIRVTDFWKSLERVMSEIDGTQPNDQTFLKFLNAHFPADAPQNRMPRSLALSFIEGFDAAHPERISTKTLAEEKSASGEQQYRVLGGYDGLLEPLTEQLLSANVAIHLGHRVTRIRWRRNHVAVEVVRTPGDGTIKFTAKRAIVTLPLGIWRAKPSERGAIRCVPELIQKRTAARKLGIGPVIKILMQFREPFWLKHRPWNLDLTNMAFIHSREVAVPTWWTTLPLRTPLLTGWCAGPAAERMAGKSDAAIAARSLDSLAQVLAFPRAKLERLVDIVKVADWQADPFARGAYSYTPVGADGAAKRLAAPVASTLFFAGEATAYEDASGTVPAAVATGHRAAMEVLKSLGKRRKWARKTRGR
jgi:monoamine oxidase